MTDEERDAIVKRAAQTAGDLLTAQVTPMIDRDVKYGEAAVAIGEALRLAAGVDSSNAE